MKFDYIVGNPPYNKGILKPHHPIYHHESLTKQRVTYTAFMALSQTLLKPDGEFVMVTPIKWAFNANPTGVTFREFMWRFDLKLDRLTKCPFDLFRDGGIGVVHLRNRPGSVQTTYKGHTQTVALDQYPAAAILPFSSEALHEQYVEACKRGVMPVMHRSDGSEGWGHAGYAHCGTDRKPYCNSSAVPTSTLNNPVYLSNRTTEYTDVVSTVAHRWRLIKKKINGPGVYNKWTILAPGTSTTFPWDVIVCRDQKHCEQMERWLNSALCLSFATELTTCLNNYATARLMPLPPENF